MGHKQDAAKQNKDTIQVVSGVCKEAQAVGQGS